MPDASTTPAPAPAPTPEELIGRFLEGPALVRAAVAHMTAEQLHAAPVEGKWSSHEVVTHIADTETGLTRRVRHALAGNEPIATPGAHPERVVDPTRDVAAELDALEQSRAALAEELHAAEPATWARPAMHFRDRELDVAALIGFMTRHLESHVAAIEEKRAALGL